MAALPARDASELPPPSLRHSLYRFWANALLLTALALPFFLFLGNSIPGMLAGALVLAVPILTLPLAVLRKAPGFRSRLEVLQVLLAGLGLAATSFYWVHVLPETLALVLPAALTGVPSARRRAGLLPAAFLSTGAAVLAFAYEASSLGVAVYLLASATAWRLARRFAPSGFRTAAAGIVTLELLLYSLAGIVYRGNDLAKGDAIARQQGISRPPWLTDVEVGTYPLHEITAFVESDGGALLLPRHQGQAIRIDEEGGVAVVETAGIVTNGLVLDAAPGRFYFASGQRLYAGDLRTLRFEERAHLRVRAALPAYVERRPATRARELLVVFDGLRYVVLYDLDSDQQAVVDVPYEISGGAWHPDGERLVLYGKDGLFRGRLLLVDRRGRIVSERPAGLFDRVEIGRAKNGLLAMYLLHGRLELFSPDTLETRWSVSATTPRAAVPSPSGRCLLVPSYSRGTLSLRSSLTGELLDELEIGRRVRAITPAPEGGAFWISSSSGPFVVNDAAFPEACRATLSTESRD